MHLEQLHYFITVASHNSINQAAEHLYITQQSLNSSMTTLENELGCKLLERSSRGIKLNKNGELLLKAALTITDTWDALQKDIAASSDNTCSVLRICTSPRMSDLIMPHLISSYKNLYPQSQVYVDEEKHLDITEGNIPWQNYDLILVSLRYKNGQPIEYYNQKLYDYSHLFEQKCCLICNRQSSLASKKYINLENLQQISLLSYTKNNSNATIHDSLNNFYDYLKLKKHPLYSDSISFCLQSLLDNQFALICTRGPITQLFAHPNLVNIPIKLPFKISSGMLRPKGQNFSQAAESFTEMLKNKIVHEKLELHN